MEVVITDGADEVAELAAGIVTCAMETTAEPVVGLATSRSPLDRPAADDLRDIDFDRETYCHEPTWQHL